MWDKLVLFLFKELSLDMEYAPQSRFLQQFVTHCLVPFYGICSALCIINKQANSLVEMHASASLCKLGLCYKIDMAIYGNIYFCDFCIVS